MKTFITDSPENNILKSVDILTKEIDSQLEKEKKIFRKLVRKIGIKNLLCETLKKN